MSDLATPLLSTVDFDPFAGAELARSAPATESQREIWAATQMGEDASCAFNESNTLRLFGPLDVEALQAAVRDLVDRHEALRSTFTTDGATILIAARLPMQIPFIDYSRFDQVDRSRALEVLLAREVEQPFDLEQGPLFRASVVRLAGEEHLLVFTAHHLVCDGWSTGVLLRDLGALYSARRSGRDAVLCAPFPFSDYAKECFAAEATADYDAAEQWWLGRFAGTPPALDLPFDATRPALKTYASIRRDFVLEPDLVSQLKHLAARSGASFFTVLFTGFGALLHRLSGADDIVVGIPSAGQLSSGHPDLVGHCVNTLPIRCAFGSDASFDILIGRVREAVLDATERSEFTFGRLVRKLALPRDPSRLPLVSVLFNLDQTINSDDLSFTGLQATFASNPRHFENFDLFLNAVESDGSLRFECQFNSDLLHPETVDRWLGALDVLLRGAVAAPDQTIARLPILPDSDRQALAEWNGTRSDFPRTEHLHELVNGQIVRTPDAVAVVAGDEQLTYAELDRLSNKLARRLRTLGVGRETRVGLCLERSTDMVVALLAVSKAGGAYVPLDPAYPAERLAFMVHDSGMPLVITHQGVRMALPPSGATVLSMDGDKSSIDAESDAALEPLRGSTAEDVAYVIYTSGSTGTPKGVLVPHRAVVNLLTCTRVTPGLNSDDVVVAITTLSFDIAVFDLWLPLTVGARIVIAPRDAGGDGPLLLALLGRSNATVLQATPATWRLLIDAGWCGGDGLKAISTGEALPLSLARELAGRASELWNMYGPTETTVWSSYYRVPQTVDSVPIGKPMANTQLYVLDDLGQRVPIGVPGELYIGGDGVTLGYLDRPELTDQRFLEDPYAARTRAKLYRTGDLVRWRRDGTLEYLGRNDHQVKVRGFRIELGEIEAQLARNPLVAENVVCAREDRPGDVRLVAYVVARPAATYNEESLRAMLRDQLPDYMVPQHFVHLDALPLTPNGKVNRAALPPPEMAGAAEFEYVAPRTENEQLLAELWQEVLGVGRIGIHDDFFQLGGHSLLAAKVTSRIARDRGVAIPMRSLFEAPTIARFAPLLTTTTQSARIPRRQGNGPAPASIMQQRSVLLEQMGSGMRTFNLPAAWRLTGELDTDALQYAINRFIQHQEATRTTLRWYGDRVVQTIAPHVELDTTPFDMRSLPAADRDPEVMRQMLAATNEPFDLAAGPLIRARLFRLADEEHILFLLVHHAIWDGWSFDIFVREVDGLYRAYRHGETEPPAELAIRYTDFAEWHNAWLDSAEIDGQVAYWHGHLAADLPPLELPTDRPRPRVLGDAGAAEWVEISRAEADVLTALGRREGVTLFVVLLAAYETMLHRYSGQNNFLVGTPVRGRAQPELEDVVGWFVNTVVLRAGFDGDPTFQELLQRVRTTVLDAFSHQDVPFEHLTMSRNPAYRAFFSFQDARNRPTAFGNLTLRQVHVLPDAAPNDLSLWMMENESGLVGGLNYSTELFDRDTIQQFLATFRGLLRTIVTDLSQPVSAVPLVADADRALVVTGPEPVDAPDLVHAAFESHVAQAPSAIAVTDGEGSLTYAQLDHKANSLAHRLRAGGVQAGSRVALCVSGLSRPIGMLAIAKAGGAVVPMDPTHPEAWLAQVATSSGATAAVVNAGLEGVFQEIGTTTVLTVNREDHTSEKAQAAFSGGNVALVDFTLGPDGEPRAVELSHVAAASILTSVATKVEVRNVDRFVAAGALSTGRSFFEIYLPLSVGAALVCAEPEVVRDGELAQLLSNSSATAMHAEPTTWRRLLNAGWRPTANQFIALASGEPLLSQDARELSARVHRAFSLYGQAETGFWCGIAELDPENRPDGFAALGTPLAGGRWQVVDSRLRPVPNGVSGELLVGGPFSSLDGKPLVRTGDRTRVHADGLVEYHGRMDDQHVIEGLHVHPAAVERVLKRHPAVHEAAVAAREDDGERRLVAWIVPVPDVDYTDSELRKWMRKLLPDAVVPWRYVDVDALPHTTDGQLDRAALPTLHKPSGVFEKVAPRTDAERLIGDLWCEALAVVDVGVHDNFFDLGGHSLACIQVISRIEKASGQRLNPRLLLLNSLEQVAAQLELGRNNMEISPSSR